MIWGITTKDVTNIIWERFQDNATTPQFEEICQRLEDGIPDWEKYVAEVAAEVMYGE